MATSRTGTTEWKRLRARVLRTSTTCHICGQPGADSVDHIIPVARGGTNDITNLAPAHHKIPPYCNRRKSNKEFAAPILKRSSSLKQPAPRSES